MKNIKLSREAEDAKRNEELSLLYQNESARASDSEGQEKSQSNEQKEMWGNSKHPEAEEKYQTCP